MAKALVGVVPLAVMLKNFAHRPALLSVLMLSSWVLLGAGKTSCTGEIIPVDTAWRWFHNNADQLPAPRSEPMDILWGARGGEIVRLRASWLQAPDSPGWQLADGAGTSGTPLLHQLLPNVFERGQFWDAVDETPNPGDAKERDGAFVMIPSATQPGQRVRFGSADSFFASPHACSALGAPTMTEPTPLTASGAQASLPSSAVIEDWDGDGYNDILTAGSGGLLWFRNDRNWKFYAGESVVGIGQAGPDTPEGDMAISVADWNGNGWRDVIFATADGVVWVMANQGPDNPPQLSPASPVQIQGDLGEHQLVSFSAVHWDDDGILDFIVGTRGQGAGEVYLALSNGGLQYSLQVLRSGLSCPGACLASSIDWDADGRADVLVASADGDGDSDLRWLRKEGTAAAPTVAAPENISLVRELDSGGAAALGDLTGDGIPDLLAIDSTRRIVLIPNVGSVLQPQWGHRREVPGAALLLGPDPVIAIVSWAPFGESAGYRRNLLVGDANGNLSLWRDANSQGAHSFASSEPIFDENGEPISASGPACPTLIYPADADPAILAVGDGDGVSMYRLQNGPKANVMAIGPLTVGSSASTAVPLQLQSPCPQAVYWDDDAFMDLVIATADRRIMLARGTDAESVFETPTPLVTQMVAAPRVARGSDWNDDGNMDLIIGSVDGHIYRFAGLESGEVSQISTRLVAGTDKLVFQQGAAIAGFDLDGEDCAKDLLVAAGTGELFASLGHVEMLDAPLVRYPLASTELDEIGNAFHQGNVHLRWNMQDIFDHQQGHIRIEMSERKNFFPPVEARMLAVDGPAGVLPDSLLDIPRLAVGERLHWRLRFVGEGVVGVWSGSGSVAVPVTGRNPVDEEPALLVDGTTPMVVRQSDSNYENLKITEGADSSLDEDEVYALLTEQRNVDNRCAMRVGYVLHTRPFVNPTHLELVVAGTGVEGRVFGVSVWQGDSWRHLTNLPQEGYAALGAELLPDDFVSGQVHVLISSTAVSSTCDSVKIDGIYLRETNTAPQAVAIVLPGEDVRTGEVVTLDATGSVDADGDPITYQWIQQAGPAVELSPDDSSAVVSFTTPAVANGQAISFMLTVSDEQLSDSAVASVVVTNPSSSTLRLTPENRRPTSFVQSGTTGVPALAFVATLEDGSSVDLQELRVNILGDAGSVLAAHLVRTAADGTSTAVSTASIQEDALVFDTTGTHIGKTNPAILEVRIDIRETLLDASQGVSFSLLLLVALIWPWRRSRSMTRAIICAVAISGCVSGTHTEAPSHQLSLRIEDPSAVHAVSSSEGLRADVAGTPIVGAAIDVRYEF